MRSFLKSIIIFSILILSGCFSSQYNQDADITTINNALFEEDLLHTIMNNGNEYIINIIKMDSLFIEGKGRVKEVDQSDWQSFYCPLALRIVQEPVPSTSMLPYTLPAYSNPIPGFYMQGLHHLDS